MKVELLNSLALTAQITSCFFMTGVISVIQLIHYPSFKFISHDFSKFHSEHCSALSLIAGPVMCIELISAAWLSREGEAWFSINLALVILLWGVTFLISVPSHNKLSHNFDKQAWKTLVKTNWLRTFIWFIRSLVFVDFLFSRGLK